MVIVKVHDDAIRGKKITFASVVVLKAATRMVEGESLRKIRWIFDSPFRPIQTVFFISDTIGSVQFEIHRPPFSMAHKYTPQE